MAYVDAGTGSGGGNLYYKYDTDKWWKLCKSGGDGSTYEGYDNNGVTNDARHTCDCCGERGSEDDLTWVDQTEENVCESCLRDHYYYGIIDNHGNEGYIHENCYTFVEATDQYYGDWVNLSNFDLVTVSNGDWVRVDDAVEDVDGAYHHIDDVTQVGENGNGAMYVLTTELHEYAEVLFKVDGAWVHEGSEEYERHMEQVEEDAENECDEPALPPVSMQDEAAVVARKWKFHVQSELVRLYDLVMPVTGQVKIEPYVQLMAHDGVVGTVALNILRGSMGSEYITGRREFGITVYTTLCKTFGVSLPDAYAPVPQTVAAPVPQAKAWPFVNEQTKPESREVEEDDRDWRATLLAAQDAGVRFSYLQWNGEWCDADATCSFTEAEHKYRLLGDCDTYKWKETLLKAQECGVRFEVYMMPAREWRTDEMVFDAKVSSSYRVRGHNQTEPTTEERMAA
jgi:hypothetical protein